MGEPEPPLDPIPPERSAFRRAVEAAARVEAQALHAHRQAMALSLRAAMAHERAAVVAGAAGLATQANLHEELASRAREAARAELTRDGLEPRSAPSARRA